MSVVDHPSAPPLSLAHAWGGEGHLVELAGPHPGPVHWVDFGGPTDPGHGADAGSGGGDATPLVLVHGLGGSHLNWVLLAPLLRTRRRVYAVDLAGFGLTPGGPQASSVADNAELLVQFLRVVVGRPCILVGNSMGGMVSLLVAGQHPDLVERLVLVDPAIPTRRRAMDRQVALTFLLYRIPRVGEMFTKQVSTRFTDERRVHDTTVLCFADPTRADPQVLEAAVTLLAYRRTHAADADDSYLAAARSILQTLGRRGGLRAVMTSVTAPVLLVHGEQDRLVPVGSAREAATEHPHWTLAVLPGLGHTPMLESPDTVADLVESWLGSAR